MNEAQVHVKQVIQKICNNAWLCNTTNQTSNSIKLDKTAPTLKSKTTYGTSWYTSNQWSTFTYEDTVSWINWATTTSCTISSEWSASTCTTSNTKICNNAWLCNTTNQTSNSIKLDKTAPSCWSWSYNPTLTTNTNSSVTATLSSSTDWTSWIATAWWSCTISTYNTSCKVTIKDNAWWTKECTSSNATNIKCYSDACWWTTPWSSCTSYSTSSPTWSCSNVVRTSKCQSNWTRDTNPYTYWSCASWCSSPCWSVTSWTTKTCYLSSSPTCPTTCSSQSYKCTNWSWSGTFNTSYTSSSCSPQAKSSSYSLTSCPSYWYCSSSVWYTVSWNSCNSYTRYHLDWCSPKSSYSLTSCPSHWNCSSSVWYEWASSSSCGSYTRYRLDSCESWYTKVWNSCKQNCSWYDYKTSSYKSLAHWSSTTVYSSSWPTCPSTCSSTSMSCNNWSISWGYTYNYSSCSPQPKNSSYSLTSCPSYWYCSNSVWYTVSWNSCSSYTRYSLGGCSPKTYSSHTLESCPSHWNCSSDWWYYANWNSCTKYWRYRLDSCESWYTKVWNSCKQNCSWYDYKTSSYKSLAHWSSTTVYSSSWPTCPSTCSSTSMSCNNWSISWGYTYNYSSCSPQPKNSSYSLTSCPSYWYCSESVWYTVSWNSCSSYTRYHLDWCSPKSSYSLTSCPSHWNCSSSVWHEWASSSSCGSYTRYKLNSCDSWYTKVWNSCKKDCWSSWGCSAASHGSKCTAYLTTTADDCNSMSITATCNDWTWSPDPSRYFATYCNSWGSTCWSSYSRYPCWAGYTAEYFINNGARDVYNCKRNWAVVCNVYKCTNSSCLFYEGNCYKADSSKPAGVEISQKC